MDKLELEFEKKLNQNEKTSQYSIYWDAFTYTSVNVVGSLLPILCGALLVYFAGTWTGWLRFLKNGEIFLVTISILISSCYTYYKSKTKKNGFSFFSSLFYFSALVLIFSVFVFSGSFGAKEVSGINIINVDPNKIKYSSIFLTLFSSVSLYFSQICEYKKNNPSAEDQRDSEFKNLLKKFNKIGK